MPLFRTWIPQNKTKNKVDNCEAKVHVYRNGRARLMFEIDPREAEKLSTEAVKAGGKLTVSISSSFGTIKGTAVDARVDTYDPKSGKLLSKTGQPGVGAFSKMKYKP